MKNKIEKGLFIRNFKIKQTCMLVQNIFYNYHISLSYSKYKSIKDYSKRLPAFILFNSRKKITLSI